MRNMTFTVNKLLKQHWLYVASKDKVSRRQSLKIRHLDIFPSTQFKGASYLSFAFIFMLDSTVQSTFFAILLYESQYLVLLNQFMGQYFSENIELKQRTNHEVGFVTSLQFYFTAWLFLCGLRRNELLVRLFLNVLVCATISFCWQNGTNFTELAMV